ncbi:hypothetical protein [Phyllobacterium myrsinacearum]|uniref:3-oxoacyl-[acyl-carrier-protein] synthase-1 n=1 Tax=Phyllobacterium myrsinacearum TaxID=28101 RepID=A0A839EQ05_9HYPH|nr:hypothetical protein [Phyllobacterium myrsinacearum]MBA8880959.1 3-oxoacyl-[acyl-carrier-protein] synthase-1 [Phyllobacterium myrsinacearum]
MTASLADIRAIGVCCPLGMSLKETATSYQNGVRNFVKSSDVIGPDGLPVRIAPVFAFNEPRNFELRLQRLFETAADDVKSQLPQKTVAADLRLIVPDWFMENPLREPLQNWILEQFGTWIRTVTFLSGKETIFLAELARALQSVSEENSSDCFVGALDSLMHAELIDILTLQDRLLTKDNPHGVIPGEGAVIAYVAQVDPGTEGALGTVLAAYRGYEEESFRKPIGVLGRGLAKPLALALRDVLPDRFMVNLNGERWRSEDISVALSASQPLPDHLAADFETPPLYCGECGVVTDAIMAALSLVPPPDTLSNVSSKSVITHIAISQRSGLRCVGIIERYVAENPV